MLEAIRGGADLKRAAPASEKPVDTRSSLLENIRGGIALKSAQNREIKAAPAKEDVHAMSVAEILARRVAIQGNSDSEGDEEDDADWDDY